MALLVVIASQTHRHSTCSSHCVI